MNARGGWALLGACVATLIVGNTVSAARGGVPAQGQGPAAGRGSAVEAQAPPALPWDEAPLAEHLFYEQAGAYRRDTLDVTVAPGPGLEVNLALKKGAVITYTWRVASPAGSSIVSEFHGHTNRAPGEAGTLMFYRKANGSRRSRRARGTVRRRSCLVLSQRLEIARRNSPVRIGFLRAAVEGQRRCVRAVEMRFDIEGFLHQSARAAGHLWRHTVRRRHENCK